MTSDPKCTSLNISSLAIESLERAESSKLDDEGAALVPDEQPKRLGFVDSYLTVWILGAMVLGVVIGYLSPRSAAAIDSWSSGSVNWPIAVGLIVMMFPPLARVNYDQVGSLLHDELLALPPQDQDQQQAGEEEVSLLLTKADPRCGEKCVCHDAPTNVIPPAPAASSKFKELLQFSLALNWVVGPFLMFFLAIACLPDGHVPYIRGLIMVGIARCIAMVIVWNDLASGSAEYAAILVCFNSLFQIVCYSPYAYFFISVLLPAFQLPGSSDEVIHVSFALVAESVAIYLGIPFAIGFSCWYIFNKLADMKDWYKAVFIPYTSPLTLIALLFTIIVMFILKGRLIVSIPLQVLRVAIPLCIYFTVMFVGVCYCCVRFGFSLEQTITLAFTSASNNFELAIAVSIAVFGLDSPEAFVGVIGPLVEVPVMLAFVYLVKVLHAWWPAASSTTAAPSYQSIGDLEAAIPSKNVLFLCTGNSCRSHMAQGWCWHYHSASLNLHAFSAGTAPERGQPGPINQYAVKAMLEYGIDISYHRSKHVADLAAIDFQLVVTVCDDAAQECPMFDNTGAAAPRIVHRSFDDPPRLAADEVDEEEIMQTYRRVCEEIRVFVRDELPNLLP